jgi:hypothetical protein
MSDEFVEGARSVYKSGKRKRKSYDESLDDSRFCNSLVLNARSSSTDKAGNGSV